jgi:ribokinase
MVIACAYYSMTVVVFGSINMDLVVRTPRLPIPGQTLTGLTFYSAPGGKGANQAVACSRLGVRTQMVGRVGTDLFGETLLQSLNAYGVDATGVISVGETPTGVALITVDNSAENTIIIIAGANGTIDDSDIARVQDRLADARVLLLQLEVPLDAVTKAARLAHKRGLMVILDPAPSHTLPAELYPLVDIITPNETEAEALVGFKVCDEISAARAAQILRERGVRETIIKMGRRGVYADDQFFPAFQVNAVDSVAAGDAFNGGIAAALSEGLALHEAVQWGLAAGALSVTKRGAQPSMPTRLEVMEMLKAYPKNRE